MLEQLPPLGTHSLRSSGQRPAQLKPSAHTVVSLQSPYCPHEVVLPASLASQTGAEASMHKELTQASDDG
jgi:epoxyqueuosine reductase QueG